MPRQHTSPMPSRSVSCDSRWARWARMGLGAGLALALGSCSEPAPTIGPLVRVSLKQLPASAAKVALKVTAQERDKTSEFTQLPLDTLGVTFPPGTMGQAELEVLVYDDAGCLISKGVSSISVDSDIDYGLPISLQPVPFCGMPASKIIVQLVNAADGAGKVSGPGIDCGGGASDCEEDYPMGQQVQLTASASKGNFLGWSGGCSGVATCSLTLTPAGDFTVQASFGVCQGWCPENSGVADSKTVWNAVYGRSTTDIIAVGNAGAITRWDGQSWKPMLSGTTKNLRAITVPRGSTSYVAVGDANTVLGYSGQGWYPIPVNLPMAKILYGVSGVSESEIRIVGQDATLLRGDLKGFDKGEGLPGSAGTKDLYAHMVQVNNGTSGEFLIAGASGYTTRRYYIGLGYWDDASPGGTKSLFSAWYANKRQVVVGQSGSIFRRIYQGVSWQPWQMETSGVTTDLNAVWGATESYILAVGAGGKIVRWDGANWGAMNSGTTDILNGVWGTSSTNAYAVGAANTIRHYVP